MSRSRKLKKWIRRNRRSLIAAGGMMLAVAIALCAVLYFTEKGQEAEKPSVSTDRAASQQTEQSSARKTAQNGAEDTEEGTTPTPVPVLVEPPDSPVVLKEVSGTRSGYLKHCVFLGDSRMVGMVNYACISDEDALAQVGISHNSVENFTFSQNSGKEYTVRSYLAARKPEVIYLGFGVNGMNYMDEDTYKKTYRTLVEHIMEMSPESRLVLMAIWPVDDDGPYKGAVKTEWVDKYNEFFLALAEEKGQYYLAVNSVLQDANGRIRKEYDGGDGLHYNAAACKVIMNYIQSHPVPGISDEGEYVVHYVAPPPAKQVTPTPPPQAATPTQEEDGEEEEDENELSPTEKPDPSPSVSANSPTPTKKDTKKPTEEPEPSEEDPEPSEEPSPTPEEEKPSDTPTGKEEPSPSGGEKPSGGEATPSGGASPTGEATPSEGAAPGDTPSPADNTESPG